MEACNDLIDMADQNPNCLTCIVQVMRVGAEYDPETKTNHGMVGSRIAQEKGLDREIMCQDKANQFFQHSWPYPLGIPS